MKREIKRWARVLYLPTSQERGVIFRIHHKAHRCFPTCPPPVNALLYPVQILSYACGLEQMSRLKCAGVIVSVVGAVWVEFFNANLAFSEDDTLVAKAGGGGGGGRWLLTGDGGGSGENSGGGDLIGSLILFWQVRQEYGKWESEDVGSVILPRSCASAKGWLKQGLCSCRQA